MKIDIFLIPNKYKHFLNECLNTDAKIPFPFASSNLKSHFMY